MRDITNPKWILVVTIIPTVLLLLIFYGQFHIIKTLLSQESILLWKKFATGLFALGFIHFGYALHHILKKKKVSFYFALFSLVCYIPFLYLYGFYFENILPFSIPRWMFSGNTALYVGTFLMPTLTYNLFVLVSHFTAKEKEHKPWKSFLSALSIPFAWYLFYEIIFPLWKPVESQFSFHAFLIILILTTLLFLFFLIRVVFIFANQKAKTWNRYHWLWKIPITIVFPLLGLAFNNGDMFHYTKINVDKFFGDFSNQWFYVLAVVNGVLLCLPNFQNKLYRLFLFIGRSITFAYTFYFFMVFLPFLPLSILAVIFAGIGFLMLTPLLLFALHINQLNKDFIFLHNYFLPQLSTGIFLFSLLMLPSFITATYLYDKKNLSNALNYVFSPNYAKTYTINKNSLQKTIATIKSHKEKNREGIFNTRLPYLSAYFNWLVLDNLTVADAKINKIEKVFWGQATIPLQKENIQNEKVSIKKISSSSKFDTKQNMWKSQIDLQIVNENQISFFSEYATVFTLPPGAWITDYYLYVNGKKEKGILSEKRSALWVYSNIRNENKDPGILYYLNTNQIAFRVFPVVKETTTKTGIELLHKEPIEFVIDDNRLQLGTAQEQTTPFENEHVAYVSALQKKALQKTQRKPYLHLIVDVSKNQKKENLVLSIEDFLEQNQALQENAKISFVNSYVSTFSIKDHWQQKLLAQEFAGGFYLERAIKSILFQNYKNPTDNYPVMVVVSDNFENAILPNHFSNWEFAFPETNLFYSLSDNTLASHSLKKQPVHVVQNNAKLDLGKFVRKYPFAKNLVAYLPDNNQASIVLKSDIFAIDKTALQEKDGNAALLMQGKWMSQVLHPETAHKEWLNLVRYSFLTKIMTPVTSYLVVENEAQKAILKKKQQQVLSSNPLLDLSEDSQRMSEPNLIWFILVLVFLFWYSHKKKAS